MNFKFKSSGQIILESLMEIIIDWNGRILNIMIIGKLFANRIACKYRKCIYCVSAAIVLIITFLKHPQVTCNKTCYVTIYELCVSVRVPEK